MEVDIILNEVKLPTLSKTLNEIIELEKSNPISIFNDMIKVIEKDPLLSVHIMKIANSPLLGFSKNVRSISHAVSLLGITQIRNIAFSFSIFDFIKKINFENEYAKVFKIILKHSSMMSSLAGIFAKNIKGANFDELYIAGMISNIGQIVFFLYSPEKYSRIFSESNGVLKAEEKEFGTNFIEMGVAFCKKESLPFFLESAIRNQFELEEKTEINKIIFITRGLTEFLLTKDEKLKKDLFNSLEKNVKKTLNLSMDDINNTIKDLPLMMDSFMTDFPEVQSELNKVINTSSEIIIDLMEKKLGLVLQSKEQAKRESKISKEKKFITNMLNLSKEFSVLLLPDKLIKIFLNYFKAHLEEYEIKVLYCGQKNENYVYYCDNENLKGKYVKIGSSKLLSESMKKNEPLIASKNDIKVLNLESDLNHIVFPISYHKNNFGFLVLGIDNSLMKNVDYVRSYLNIISNIIANSFQNYFSFVNIKLETQKKEKIANELIKNDERLIKYEANETILSKSNVLEEILPVIFHKLKNKLTPILGYSQLLASISEDTKIVDKLKRIERNASELTNILDSMSSDINAIELVKKLENINDLMLKMKPYFLKIENELNITIDLELDPSIEEILLSRGQIINLIMNLVQNSVDALKNKVVDLKKIEIKTQMDGNSLLLKIKDNGIGIDDESLMKIWAPFYSTNEINAGIGLTACERVLSNHNAKFEFRSKIGEYTEFKAEFPLSAENNEAIEKKRSQRHKFSNLNILIVDDEESLVTLMKEILQLDTDLIIATVTNGNDAINLINEKDFILIISDIQMPGINGMDIFEHLKGKGIEDRLLMVTGNPYISNIASFLKENKIQYLKKPFELMEFRRLVNEKIEEK